MPSKSRRQHNAMEAAAHGHSTLGIPERVAKEFLKHDQAQGLWGSKKKKRKSCKRKVC